MQAVRGRGWLWDGSEPQARCWHVLAIRELGSPKTIKYVLSHAPAETSLERLVQRQRQRFASRGPALRTRGDPTDDCRPRHQGTVPRAVHGKLPAPSPSAALQSVSCPPLTPTPSPSCKAARARSCAPSSRRSASKWSRSSTTAIQATPRTLTPLFSRWPPADRSIFQAAAASPATAPMSSNRRRSRPEPLSLGTAPARPCYLARYERSD